MGECVVRGTLLNNLKPRALLPFLSRIYFVSIIKIFSSVPLLSFKLSL